MKKINSHVEESQTSGNFLEIFYLKIKNLNLCIKLYRVGFPKLIQYGMLNK